LPVDIKGKILYLQVYGTVDDGRESSSSCATSWAKSILKAFIEDEIIQNNFVEKKIFRSICVRPEQRPR
jgi:hypothetical protein